MTSVQPVQTLFSRATFWRLFAAALFVELVVIRIPGLLPHGRFWAEEGTIYFTNAWRLPWWRALLRPEVGYLNLVANAATVLARHAVRLERAPEVTVFAAFAIQSIPPILLICARDAWLRPPAVRIAAIAILAMPPCCDEVWLNTANSQFHLALAAALCLALDVPGAAGSVLYALLLFLAPLSSPACIALVPLFAGRAAFDRDRGRALQAACIAAGVMIQFAVFYSPWPGRGHLFGPATLAAIVTVKHLAIPFFGEQEAVLISKGVHDDIVASQYPIAAMLAVSAFFGALLAAIVLRRRAAPFWLLAAGGAIAALSYFGGIADGFGLMTATGSNRYAFVPSMLFALCILSLVDVVLDRITLAACFIIVWLIAIAAQQAILPQPPGYVTGPDWRAEIARWRTDQTVPIAIWPVGWHMHLSPFSGGRDAGEN